MDGESMPRREGVTSVNQVLMWAFWQPTGDRARAGTHAAWPQGRHYNICMKQKEVAYGY